MEKAIYDTVIKGTPLKEIVCVILAILLISTPAFSQSSSKVKIEKNRKIANGVVYSGPSVKEHIPTGNGRLTFSGQKKENFPDIIIVGSFDGNQIFDAALYQGDTLRFWGDMTYKIQANKSVALTLKRGEVYDRDGNIRYWVDDKSPVVLNNSASEKTAADLRGNGSVITYIDPLMSARYNLMANNGVANSQSYKLIVKGNKWTISSSDARFTWDGQYDFDSKDYTTCLNQPLHLIYGNDYDISPDEDAFNRLIDVETPDTILYYTLLRMSQARPMVRKGFSHSYSQSEYPYYHIEEINNKDRIWLDNGAYTFYANNTTTKGCANFFGTPRQDYAEPHVVCIRKPEHEQTIKISKNALTLVAKGTIQLDCDFNRSDGSPKTPAVNKFSTSDCFWGLSRINKHADLSEGIIHNVTIPFLGQEAAWKVSSSTKIWATPRSTNAGSYKDATGRVRSTGDPYPPHRAVRTVTQTLNLNTIAQKAGITIQELLIRLAATGIDGLINIKNGPLLVNGESPRWTEIGLYAATWMAGGFTDPDKDFNNIIKKSIPANSNKMAKEVWIAKHKGYSHVLDFCATQIESATSLASLYNVFIELYPNVLPNDTDISNPKQLFYSAVFFSSYSDGNETNPIVYNYRKRIQNKLVALLNKENSDTMEEFLLAVQSFGYTQGAFHYANHPVPSVRKALKAGLTQKEYFDYPTLYNGILFTKTEDSIIREKFEGVLTQSCEIAISELKKFVDRDIVCNDNERLTEDLALLEQMIDYIHKSNYYYPNIDPGYFSSVENARKGFADKNKLPAPKNSDAKTFIKQFFGITHDFTETAFGINMRMVYVEGGSFDMGCTSEQKGGCNDNESPTRYTTVKPFYIGMLEVTQSQWEKVMGTTIVQQKNKLSTDDDIRGQGPNYPMYFVNYEDAKEFCMRLSNMTGKRYRLPTEAEWEYAARGGNNNEGTMYSGSKKAKNVAWYYMNSDLAVHVCGTKQPNVLGIYDMSGNVYEWCGDWFGPYQPNDNDNPHGAVSGTYRVIRGGGWSTTDRGCRVSNRVYLQPDERKNHLGFRVVVGQ